MQDLTYCKGGTCPMKSSCIRYEPDNQEIPVDALMEPPYDGENCSEYWPRETEPYTIDPDGNLKDKKILSVP